MRIVPRRANPTRAVLAAVVTLCIIAGGGHHWPGGVPPASAGLPDCPFGYQSQSFLASQKIWDFFSQHPKR